MHDKKADVSKSQAVLPAIAPKDGQTNLTAHDSAGSTMSLSHRAKLPPRSRTGCWTCRTRKVKCDEGKPICGQCHRLGHTCDYSPRLSFRDDTRRIVDRMRQVLIRGNHVWDSTSRPLTCQEVSLTKTSEGDTLPPFALLTSDEEREKKAEHREPGTFHVIMNPESFSNLPEYRHVKRSSGRQSSITKSRITVIKQKSSQFAQSESNSKQHSKLTDPDVIILAQFEESTRRLPPAKSSTSSSLSSSSAPSSIAMTLGSCSIHNSPKVDVGDYEAPSESFLLNTFMTVVSRRLEQVYRLKCSLTRDSSDRPVYITDIYDRYSGNFPPIKHAMMALSALSLNKRVDAMEHYSQVIYMLQAMSPSVDIAADGALLTHFLLLLYELGAAEPRGSNLWIHHLERLAQIFVSRRTIYDAEPFASILYRALCIDIHASLTSHAGGHLFMALQRHGILPGYNAHLLPVGPDGLTIIHNDEESTLLFMLKLDHDMRFLAAELGQMAKQFRSQRLAFLQHNYFRSIPVEWVHQNQQQIFQWLNKLHRAFQIQVRDVICSEKDEGLLPDRSKAIYCHALGLYRACIIYAYTSMWPCQRMDAGPGPVDEIQRITTEILQAGRKFVKSRLPGQHFITFSLFLAGFATKYEEEKRLSLILMDALEDESIGGNLRATINFLDKVFARQHHRTKEVGHCYDVDWMEMMFQDGFGIINFGI